MDPAEAPDAGANLGRHRAPDADAQTAFIPRITDVSPDGVPGGPLAPPVGLGGATGQADAAGQAGASREARATGQAGASGPARATGQAGASGPARATGQAGPDV